VNHADPSVLARVEETATSLDRRVDAAFMKIARETTRQTAEELRTSTLDTLKRPAIGKPDTGVTVFHADKRVLVIGNSWFDADGAVWAEYINSYRWREEIALHVEALTDLTPRQRRIMETVGRMQASMGRDRLDPDALDGFGDYAVDNALAHIVGRKGKLDQVLALKVRWDAVIVQGFRGASEPAEDDFFGSGRALIAKVRASVGDTPLHLMQHWARKGATPGEQARINAAYGTLSAECGVAVIPVGEAFAAKKDVELLSHGYTPNVLGVQLISETLRKHVRLM
jgi:hypothetical protein